MKTCTPIIIVLILCILLLGCTESHNPRTHCLTTIIDLSDEKMTAPTSQTILEYLPQADQVDGVTLSYSFVSDTRYSPKHSFEIQQGTQGWLSNEDKRRRDVKFFYRQFEDSIKHHNKEQKPLRQSEVFRLVMRELNTLAEGNTGGTLLLMSDLKEHSMLFSVYDLSQRQQLIANPAAIQKIFETSTNIADDLSGIVLHILHKPSIEEDMVFTQMVTIYSSIVQSRGGSVIVGERNTVSL